MHPLIKPFLKPILVGVVVITAIWYHQWKVASLTEDLDNMTRRFNTLSVVTEIQTAEVRRLEVIGKHYEDSMKAAAKRNQEDNKKWEVIFSGLRNKPVPKDCVGAMQHLRDTTQGLAVEFSKK